MRFTAGRLGRSPPRRTPLQGKSQADYLGEVDFGFGLEEEGVVAGAEAGAAIISPMIFAVRALLTGQAESLMRHCASVNLQPQSQDSALKRWSAIFLCSGVSLEKSTPGSWLRFPL